MSLMEEDNAMDDDWNMNAWTEDMKIEDYEELLTEL